MSKKRTMQIDVIEEVKGTQFMQCKLLLNGKWNISEISLECGFESVAHFNRCFKKHTGMTPTSYRKKIQ